MEDSGRKDGEALWKCRCDCGAVREIKGGDLRNGSSKSCGCLRADLGCPMKSHGESKSRLYKIWKGMKARCYLNDGGRTYRDYGGRGIRMCDEWKNSYESFSLWAKSKGYNDDMSIERIDVNGNYEPGNCTFIRLEDQSANRRNTMLTVNGVTKTKAQWAEEAGIGLSTLSSRLNKLGWPPEQAVSTPAREMRHAE